MTTTMTSAEVRNGLRRRLASGSFARVICGTSATLCRLEIEIYGDCCEHRQQHAQYDKRRHRHHMAMHHGASAYAYQHGRHQNDKHAQHGIGEIQSDPDPAWREKSDYCQQCDDDTQSQSDPSGVAACHGHVFDGTHMREGLRGDDNQLMQNKVTTLNYLKMKRLIVLLVMICGMMPLLWASDGCDQHLSPEEFRAKQKAFITEKAGLTSEEAAKFFPLYFELQDRKKQLNDEAWKLLRQGKDEKTTEAQYEEIMEGVYDARIASDRLDKTYFDKFKKILSCKKIYLVQRAEMRFHRELLKGMHKKGDGPQRRPQGKK